MAMHVPRQFREERSEVLARAARGIGLHALVTSGHDGLHVSHVPVVPKKESGAWTLETRVVRCRRIPTEL